MLQRHDYSGNVRELINILQRAVTLCEGSTIEPEDLMLEQGVVESASGEMPGRLDEQSLDTYMGPVEEVTDMCEDLDCRPRSRSGREGPEIGRGLAEHLSTAVCDRRDEVPQEVALVHTHTSSKSRTKFVPSTFSITEVECPRDSRRAAIVAIRRGWFRSGT